MKKYSLLIVPLVIIVCLGLFSWQNLPILGLARRIAHSETFIAMNEKMDKMDYEIRLESERPHKTARKYKAWERKAVMNDKTLNAFQQEDSLAKMGLVQSPGFKKYAKEYQILADKLRAEFPEITKMPKTELKEVFAEATGILSPIHL